MIIGFDVRYMYPHVNKLRFESKIFINLGGGRAFAETALLFTVRRRKEDNFFVSLSGQ